MAYAKKRIKNKIVINGVQVSFIYIALFRKDIVYSSSTDI